MKRGPIAPREQGRDPAREQRLDHPLGSRHLTRWNQARLALVAERVRRQILQVRPVDVAGPALLAKRGGVQLELTGYATGTQRSGNAETQAVH